MGSKLAGKCFAAESALDSVARKGVFQQGAGVDFAPFWGPDTGWSLEDIGRGVALQRVDDIWIGVAHQ